MMYYSPILHKIHHLEQKTEKIQDLTKNSTKPINSRKMNHLQQYHDPLQAHFTNITQKSKKYKNLAKNQENPGNQE